MAWLFGLFGSFGSCRPVPIAWYMVGSILAGRLPRGWLDRGFEEYVVRWDVDQWGRKGGSWLLAGFGVGVGVVVVVAKGSRRDKMVTATSSQAKLKQCAHDNCKMQVEPTVESSENVAFEVAGKK